MYTVGRRIEGYAGDTSDEVERIVRENAESGFDFINVSGDLPPEHFDRLHDTAKQLF